MKVLMLNPPYVDGFCRSARWAAKSRGRVQRHPDWMAIATAVLEDAGHDAKLFDCAPHNTPKSKVKRELEKFDPELVVIHTTTPSIYSDLSFAQLTKNTVGADCITALIGPHPTALPEDTLRLARGYVDVIARREYDYTLKDLADGYPFEDILGLSYIKNEKIVHNPDRPFIENLDELPYPAWHHIKPEWYHDGGKLYPFLTLISGRGCFGRCSFCRDTQTMYGHKLRLRSPEKVVDEMEYCFKKFPQIKEIMIETDTFTANPNHVKSVCKEILDRGLNITWSANSRVDRGNSELFKLMKKAGCRMLLVGFEFGSQKALDSIKKGTTLQQAQNFAELTKEAGIKVFGAFMIGAPGETRETALKTIRFAKKLPIAEAQFSGIAPYPGTEFYDWAKSNGYITAKDWKDWVNEDFEQVSLLSYPQLTNEEINTLVDKGLKEFYLRPSKIFSQIIDVRNLADLRRKIFGVRSFIDYFT